MFNSFIEFYTTVECEFRCVISTLPLKQGGMQIVVIYSAPRHTRGLYRYRGELSHREEERGSMNQE